VNCSAWAFASESLQNKERPPRRGRAKIGIALGAVAVGAGVMISATPASATDHGCSNINNGINVCLTITGAGRYVNSFDVIVNNYSALIWANTHIEIQAPNGTAFRNSGQFTLPARGYGEWLVGVQADVSAGNWCAIAWHWNGSGHNNFGERCEPVRQLRSFTRSMGNQVLHSRKPAPTARPNLRGSSKSCVLFSRVRGMECRAAECSSLRNSTGTIRRAHPETTLAETSLSVQSCSDPPRDTGPMRQGHI
jgi:hypothetical protein